MNNVSSVPGELCGESVSMLRARLAGQTFKVLVYTLRRACISFRFSMYVCGGVAGSVVVDDLIFGGVGHSGSGAYPVVSYPPNNSTIA